MSSPKIVVVGDESVGKSCFIITHSTGVFPHDRIPIILSILSEFTNENNEVKTEILFYDTFGARDFDYARHCLYTGADVFLICFSLVDHLSFQNVLSRWNTEVRRNCSTTPIILVGLKSDLRPDTEILNQNLNTMDSIFITSSQGLSMANAINAIGYVECSSITKTGFSDINKLLDEIIRGQSRRFSDSTLELDYVEVRRNSSLGNSIMAGILLLLVFIILFSTFAYKNKKSNNSLPQNRNNTL